MKHQQRTLNINDEGVVENNGQNLDSVARSWWNIEEILWRKKVDFYKAINWNVNAYARSNNWQDRYLNFNTSELKCVLY